MCALICAVLSFPHTQWAKENAQADEEFKKLKEKGDFKECPKCGQACEKISGGATWCCLIERVLIGSWSLFGQRSWVGPCFW